MTEAKIGQRVEVGLAGLEAPGIAFGEGVFGVGEIIGIDQVGRQITVKLEDLSIDGKSVITAPAEQVTILPQQAFA